MPYRLAILGHPIGHSLSPIFHSAALRSCGIEGTYERLDIAPHDLAGKWGSSLSGDFHGFNVTLPHKSAIIPLLDDLTDGARSIGAVNVLVRRGGAWTGHNTDVVGITNVLLPHRERIAGRPAVVIGAGGAARAVLSALVGPLGCPEIMVINRDVQKAATLSQEWVSRGAAVAAASLRSAEAAAALRESGLIVQATSVGMHPDHESSPIAGLFDVTPDQTVFDLIYRPRQTRFLRDALAAGASVIDGLEMFLHQAAASFELWTGATLSPDAMRPVIEKEISDQ